MIEFFSSFNGSRFRRAFVYRLLRLLQKIRCFVYRFLLSNNSASLEGVRLNQPAQFVGEGKIIFHDVNIGVWPSPGFITGYAYFEARHSSASIKIGEGSYLNNGAVIIADKSTVEIGKRCMIGLNFSAVDSDFHGLEIENRKNGNYECADVYIGDDVFIGSDVRILKGVRVGSGAVIGSGSLVARDVAERTIHAGVPAKFIRNIY